VKRSRVVIVLETADILAVEQACLDEDAEAALRFVRERVKPQMGAAQKSLCDPQMHLRGELGEQVAEAIRSSPARGGGRAHSGGGGG
jgi:hypothetical protein